MLFNSIHKYSYYLLNNHDDVIKWKHFPRYWTFVREIHRSPVNFPHKGQWRRALMFALICVWINSWVNNSEAGNLRRYRAHYDVIVMAAENYTLWYEYEIGHDEILIDVNTLTDFINGLWAKNWIYLVIHVSRDWVSWAAMTCAKLWLYLESGHYILCKSNKPCYKIGTTNW